MQAWQLSIQLLQLHLLELDPSRKQPAASTSAVLLSRARSNQDQLQRTELSITAVSQMLQAEVPLRVVSACCKVLQHSSSARSSTAAAPAPAHPHAYERELISSLWRVYCLELLYLLQTALMKLGLLRTEQPIVLPPAAIIGQQFQQSGFLDLLPQLLQVTADQLQAAATVSSSDTSSEASSSTGSSAQQGTKKQGNKKQAKLTQQDWPTRPDLLLLRCASNLLFTYTTLSYCWPRGKFAFELVPACAPAVVQLASISFQRASQLLDHYQLDAFSHMAVYELWVSADEAVRLALTPDADTTYMKDSTRELLDSSGLQQYYSVLFDSPHTSQCMAVMLASAVYTALLLQLPHLPDMSASSSSCSGSGGGGSSSGDSSSRSGGSGGSSSSSSSSGGGSKSKPARKLRALQCTDPSKAWQYACEQHQLLPPTHQALLQQVGCSSRSVLSAAACMAAKWDSSTGAPTSQPSVGLRAINRLDALNNAFTAHCERMWVNEQQQQRQQQHNISQEQQRQQQLLLCLMPGVLLYYAALQPATVPPGIPASVQRAVYSSRCAVGAAMELAGRFSIFPRMMQLSSSQRMVCLFIPASVHDTLLADVLPLATRIGARYLATFGAKSSNNNTGMDSGGSSSTGTNSSSSSSRRDSTTTGADSSSSSTRGSNSSSTSSGVAQVSGGTGGMSTMPVGEHVETQHVKSHDVALHLVLLLTMLSENTDFAAAGAASDAGAAQVQAAASAAVWQQHTLAVAQLLEGAVRHNPVNTYMLRGLIGDEGPGPIAAGAGAAGPGSPEQQQLVSLLCSTLKATPGGELADMPVSNCLCVLGAATAALCGSDAAAAAAAAATGSNTRAVAAVPWLAIIGRCLLQLAALLPAARTSPAPNDYVKDGLCFLVEGVQQVTETLQGLLCDDGPTSLPAQLIAAGFSSWEAIPAQLQPMADVAGALLLPDGSPPSHAQVSTAAELMTALGLSLNCLAFPTACNNPHCSNLSGPSELLQVSGRSNMCAGCLVARYCSRDCQRQHWKQHKPVCKALAAAAAAAKTANADSAAAAAAAAAK